jgi:hypothetical protein
MANSYALDNARLNQLDEPTVADLTGLSFEVPFRRVLSEYPTLHTERCGQVSDELFIGVGFQSAEQVIHVQDQDIRTGGDHGMQQID